MGPRGNETSVREKLDRSHVVAVFEGAQQLLARRA